MINAPLTKEQAAKVRYGQWAGNPKGAAWNPTRCAMEVMLPGRGMLFHQCSRKPGHGPGAMYCKQHSKRFEERV